jgi:hypothetical protein
MEPEEAAVARQWHDKHIFMATITHAAIEDSREAFNKSNYQSKSCVYSLNT